MQKATTQPNHAIVQKKANMLGKISPECGKQRKNFELEAELKLAREENALLRKELEALRNGRVPEPRSEAPIVSNGETKKMQGAFQAMKNLLISQEESLHSLRTEVQQSRKRAREQEQMLDYFKTQLAAYKNTQKAHTTANLSNQALGKQVERLEEAFAHERGKTSKLQEKLSEKNKAIESLRARLETKVQRRKSESSMISRKASGTSNKGQSSRNLGLIRRKSSRGSVMMDVKSLTSKRTATTATTATTSSSYPSKISANERSLDDAIHCATADALKANRDKLSRKASIRRKHSGSKKVPSKTDSPPSRIKEKTSCDARAGPSILGEKKKVITRRKSDLSMIRKASACQRTMDTDSRSMVIPRTARSCSSLSKTSAASPCAIEMNTHQAIQKEGCEEEKREFHSSFGSNGAACFGGFEGEDNHSIKEDAWSLQGSRSDIDFW